MSMTESEAIRWLKEMQNPVVSEAELYCAETCYGTGKMVYPEPEDYVFETAITALEEIQQYRAIGTVSEFRELKEKATAKKVAYQGEHEKCPSCGSFHVFDKYCSKCGQAVEFD